MASTLIARTERYCLSDLGDQLAYLIADLSTGVERLLAFDEAYIFRHELLLLKFAHNTVGTPQAGKSWEACIEGLLSTYMPEPRFSEPTDAGCPPLVKK